jgi:hypothetical protein
MEEKIVEPLGCWCAVFGRRRWRRKRATREISFGWFFRRRFGIPSVGGCRVICLQTLAQTASCFKTVVVVIVDATDNEKN